MATTPPITDYDEKNADDATAAVNGLVTEADLDAIQAHEKANKNRSTVLDAIKKRRAVLEQPSADKFTVERLRTRGDRLLASEGASVTLAEIAGAFHRVDTAEEFTISEAIERVEEWRGAEDQTNAMNEAARADS